MTNEELNTQLYQKMSAEQEQYRAHLLTLSPAEILNHCYEYAVREDILLEMENIELPDNRCRALLKSQTPLADVFHEFEQHDTGYMDHISDMIDAKADALIREGQVKARQDAR